MQAFAYLLVNDLVNLQVLVNSFLNSEYVGNTIEFNLGRYIMRVVLVEPDGILLERVLARKGLFGIVVECGKSLQQGIAILLVGNTQDGCLVELAVDLFIFCFKGLNLAIYGLVMKGATWCELDFFLMTAFFLCPVDIFGDHLVLGFNRHQDTFKVFASLGPELVKRHGCIKNHMPFIVAMEFLLLNAVDAATLVTSCIQIVEILDDASFGEGNGKCVHCMMPMIVAFCPVFDALYLFAGLVGISFCQPKRIVFFPV